VTSVLAEKKLNEDPDEKYATAKKLWGMNKRTVVARIDESTFIAQDHEEQVKVSEYESSWNSHPGHSELLKGKEEEELEPPL